MKKLLEDFPFVIEHTIAWGEMDAFGHVNNTVYFRYFEDVRIHCFEKTGILENMEITGKGPILASTDARFKLPLKYPDTISIGTRIDNLEEDRFTMQYIVVSHSHEKIAATGKGLIVFFNYNNNTKSAIDKSIVSKINEMQR